MPIKAFAKIATPRNLFKPKNLNSPQRYRDTEQNHQIGKNQVHPSSALQIYHNALILCELCASVVNNFFKMSDKSIKLLG